MNTYTNHIDPLDSAMIGYANTLNSAEEIGADTVPNAGGYLEKATFESDCVCFLDLRTLEAEDAHEQVKKVLADFIEEVKRVLGESPKVVRMTPVVWVNEPSRTENPYGTLGFFRFMVIRNSDAKTP